jgi:hypothetical protein
VINANNNNDGQYLNVSSTDTNDAAKPLPTNATYTNMSPGNNNKDAVQYANASPTSGTSGVQYANAPNKDGTEQYANAPSSFDQK